MKARPILFSSPMVLALLDGRKGQTRRVAKPKFEGVVSSEMLEDFELRGYCTYARLPADPNVMPDEWVVFPPCPYGKAGDLLWVRETFMPATNIKNHKSPKDCLYRADGESLAPWKPSIFMPRTANRITLEIVSVRVERLRDISERDALAEGFMEMPATGRITTSIAALYMGRYWYTARAAFQELWQSINGTKSWQDNPWVWAIEFKVHKCNVDEFMKTRAAA